MDLRIKEFTGLSSELLEKGNIVRLRAQGESMYPFIRDGDILCISPSQAQDVRYADIVYCRNLEGKAIIHRVIKKKNKEGMFLVLTKGDSSSQSDGYIGSGNIFGKVIMIEKGNASIGIENGLLRLINIIYARFLPLSKWAYLFIAKIIKQR